MPLAKGSRVVLLCGLLLASAPASAATQLDSPVQDDGELFSLTDQAELIRSLEQLRADKGIWFVVHVAASLQGMTIEDYAERYFREHQIGDAERDNGLLLVLALNERKSRLEVGYGLEADIPDARAHQLLVEVLQPAMREGRPLEGVLSIVSVLRGEATLPPPQPAPAPYVYRPPPEPEPVDLIPLPWAVVFVGTWSTLFAVVLTRQHQRRRVVLGQLLTKRAEEYLASFNLLRVLVVLFGLAVPAALYVLVLRGVTSAEVNPEMNAAVWFLMIFGSLALAIVLQIARAMEGLFFVQSLKSSSRRFFGEKSALKDRFEHRWYHANKKRSVSTPRRARSSVSSGSATTTFSTSRSSSSSYSSSSSSSYSGGGSSGGGGASSGW